MTKHSWKAAHIIILEIFSIHLFWTFNKFPGDTYVAGTWIILWGPLSIVVYRKVAYSQKCARLLETPWKQSPIKCLRWAILVEGRGGGSKQKLLVPGAIQLLSIEQTSFLPKCQRKVCSSLFINTKWQNKT